MVLIGVIHDIEFHRWRTVQTMTAKLLKEIMMAVAATHAVV